MRIGSAESSVISRVSREPGGLVHPPGCDATRPVGFDRADRFTDAVGQSAGATGRAASGPRTLELTPKNQGETNGCGTASLAGVMSYWGRPTEQATIDRQIRRANGFSAPDDLVRYANQNGMRASLKQGGSLEDLARMVDQGVPPITLVEPFGKPNPNDVGLHYVTVVGYQRDASGRIASVKIADTAGGQTYDVSARDFERHWSDLRVLGVSTGLDRVMITAVPRDGRTIVGSDGVERRAASIRLPGCSPESYLSSMPGRTLAQGAMNVVNGAASGQVGTTLGGVIQLAAARTGIWLAKAPLPSLQWAGRVIAAGGYHLGEGVKTVVNGAQRVVQDAGRALGSAAKKVGRALRRLF
jgi:hypothetical protein